VIERLDRHREVRPLASRCGQDCSTTSNVVAGKSSPSGLLKTKQLTSQVPATSSVVDSTRSVPSSVTSLCKYVSDRASRLSRLSMNPSSLAVSTEVPSGTLWSGVRTAASARLRRLSHGRGRQATCEIKQSILKRAVGANVTARSTAESARVPESVADSDVVGSDQFDEVLVKAVAQATLRGLNSRPRADGPGADATTRRALDTDRMLCSTGATGGQVLWDRRARLHALMAWASG
jgi:hypothetical protein